MAPDDDPDDGDETDVTDETAADGPDAPHETERPVSGEDGPGAFDVTAALDNAAYVAVAFALAGVGFGALVLLLSQFGVDATILERSSAQTGSKAFTESVIITGLTVALFLPLFLSPVVGFVVANAVDDVRNAVVTAGIGLLLGAFVFYVLAGYTGGLQFPTRTARGTQYARTFVLTNGAINGLLLGLISGPVAGLSAGLASLFEE